MAQNPNSKRQQYVNNSMNNNNNNFNDNNNNNFNNNMNNNNNMMGNNNNFNNNNNMGMNNNMGNNYQPQQQQQQQSSISCDQLGSTTDKTRQIIHKAINSVISGGQATNPESISVALRNAGFMALLFNGGHGFWWNFECEWSEWSFESNGRSESYRIIVWKPSQNK